MNDDKEEMTMPDYAGNSVKAGNTVIYIRKAADSAWLAKGTVKKIVKMFGKRRAQISGACHTVESQSICKV
jgi:hypothetical protein